MVFLGGDTEGFLMVSDLRAVDERIREIGYAIMFVNCNQHFFFLNFRKL